MKTTTLVIAGGNGTRFWPASRKHMPKQFLKFDGEHTLLNLTLDRALRFSQASDRFIIGNVNHKSLFENTLPEDFQLSNLFLEPMAKNTAGAICSAVIQTHRSFGNHVMVVLPSDHHIPDIRTFESQVKRAVQLATTEHKVVTLGIKPTFPSTGYGYLKGLSREDSSYELEQFVEKPNYEIALEYVQSGQYFWNAGIFVFETSVMLEHFRTHQPEILDLANQIGNWEEDLRNNTLSTIYEQLHSVSIDEGIMEKISEILMLELDCGWSDLGSWDAMDTIKPTDSDNNVVEGDVVLLDTESSVVIGANKLVAVVGLKDIVVVDTEDAMLICPKSDVQKIKALVGQLKSANKTQLI